MMQRCYRPSHKNFQRYGGKGITVCQRWHNFKNFSFDMGDRPSVNHSIDRLDANGNYDENNCRWATDFEQQHFNKKDVKLTPFDVETIKTLRAGGMLQTLIAKIFGIHQCHVSRVVNNKRWGQLQQESRG